MNKKIQYMSRFVCLVLISSLGLVTLGSCGSSTNYSAYYSGSWSGTIAANGSTSGTAIVPTTLGVALYQTQSGSTIYGDFTATGSGSTSLGGTVSGTESSSSMTLTFTIPAGQYINGTQETTSGGLVLTGTLTLSGSTLSGTLTGTGTSLTVSLTQSK